MDKADAVYNALHPDQTRQVAATASASPTEKPDQEKATVAVFSGKGQGKGQVKKKDNFIPHDNRRTINFLANVSLLFIVT